MQTRKNYRRKTRKMGFGMRMGVLSVIALSAVCAFFIFVLPDTPGGPVVSTLASIELSAPESQVQMTDYERKIYPYSIIPGGARSREELSAVVQSDHVVAEHYADFDISNAKVTTASKTRAMYVSYRKDDTVYWTANKIQIPQGETLITDGTHEARTRCGNLLSDTPMTPTAGETEPDAEVFDIPQSAKMDSPWLEPFIESGLTPLGQFPEEQALSAPSNENVSSASSRIPTYSSRPGGYIPAFVAYGNPGGSGYVTPGSQNGSGNIKPGSPNDSGYVTPGSPNDSGHFTPGSPEDHDVSEVPEPGTMIMVLTGLAAMVIVRNRLRKQ